MSLLCCTSERSRTSDDVKQRLKELQLAGATSQQTMRSLKTRRGGAELVMSADCGGTNSRLRLLLVDAEAQVLEGQEAPGTLVAEEKYPNILFKSLDAIIENFLSKYCTAGEAWPSVAVLAVAGVVAANRVRFTNLDWTVDGFELASKFDIKRVEIINDFVAQGYGTLTLGDEDIIKLNGVPSRKWAPIACIGAGTGLGHCFLVADPSGEYVCYPSESGHVEFAPRGRGKDDEQVKLLQHLKIKFSGWNRISVERVVSGKGICNIYEYLAHAHPERVEKKMHEEYKGSPGDAGIVSRHATPGSLCQEALDIFAGCYGASCGSFAITVMPFRGLFVTGGVSKRLAHLLKDPEGEFQTAYRDKGRVAGLLEQVPLFLVNNDDMGQRGAHLRSVRLLLEERRGVQHRVAQADEIAKSVMVPPRSDYHSTEQKMLNSLAQDMQEFQLHARMSPISESEKDAFEPELKTKLYLLGPGGDRNLKEDYKFRDMWLSKNGSLITQDSQDEKTWKVVAAQSDLSRATSMPVPNEESAAHPWTFEIRIDGHEVLVLAAESDAARNFWLEKLSNVATRPQES